MIKDENFDLHITMKSGREYLFEVSRMELDWLFDKLFERESGSFQNFGTDEVINVSEIEYLKHEKVSDESTDLLEYIQQSQMKKRGNVSHDKSLPSWSTIGIHIVE